MLTVPEVAHMMGRNPETIRRWIRSGALPARKFGTLHVIDEDDLALVGYRPTSGGAYPPSESHADIADAIKHSRAERSARIAEAVALYAPGRPRPRDPGDSNTWLPAIVGRIVRLVDPVRIVLFGSRAHGTAQADSDYDILVLVDELPDRRGTRLSIARELADVEAPVDVVVAATAEVASDRRGPRGIVQWAAEQGRVVYERA
jgi:excisionase family DNA binding protein